MKRSNITIDVARSETWLALKSVASPNKTEEKGLSLNVRLGAATPRRVGLAAFSLD